MSESDLSPAYNNYLPVASVIADVWTDADTDWEFRQEQAAVCVVEGHLVEAGRIWREAHDLARGCFSDDDPRLASSVANCGFYAAYDGDQSTAAGMYAEAVQLWEGAAEWIDAMKVERRARSSTFHLRMETRHWNTYEQAQRRQQAVLGVEGKAAIRALIDKSPLRYNGFSRWQREKPSQLTDFRKLLSAVLLVTDNRAINNRDKPYSE